MREKVECIYIIIFLKRVIFKYKSFQCKCTLPVLFALAGRRCTLFFACVWIEISAEHIFCNLHWVMHLDDYRVRYESASHLSIWENRCRMFILHPTGRSAVYFP